MMQPQKLQKTDAVCEESSISMLSGGAAAFSEILRCIREAQESIAVNMFIWRGDGIGTELAEALLKAADRGVRIDISVDRLGALFEYAEESGITMFHERLSILEAVKARGLVTFRSDCSKSFSARQALPEVGRRLLSHPNVTVERDTVKSDHSKFYVFDGKILILGGVNVEDKERTADARGYCYQDYMVKLDGAHYVSAFYDKRHRNSDTLEEVRFVMNLKKPVRRFECEAHYIDMLRKSRDSITVVMAYFSLSDAFVKEFLDADRRGVRVRILLSASANFQDASNKRAAKRLMKGSGNRIEVFFSPLMLHTKLIISDGTVSVGSCNMSRKAFRVLDELNVVTDRPSFVREILHDTERFFADAERADSADAIRYNTFVAFVERLFA